jgi:hypothetical protein
MRLLLTTLLLLTGLGVSGCGPEESESMRQQRDARVRENAQTKELLKSARRDVRDQRRQLGLSTR